MIFIITGGIDEGKTRKMETIYRKIRKGDGWVSKKIFTNAGFTGYEIVRLSTGEKLPLAYKKEHVPPDWDEIERIGPFHFSKQTFEFAGSIITEIIEKNIEPVFIDEIGPLELQGKGFCKDLQRVLNTQKDIYIVVRSHCVEEVINKFNLKNYRMINLSTA